MALFLTLNKLKPVFSVSNCWLWLDKCFLGSYITTKLIKLDSFTSSIISLFTLLQTLKLWSFVSFSSFSFKWCKKCRGVFRTLTNINDGAFCEISWRKKAFNYFSKTLSFMRGLWYTSEIVDFLDSACCIGLHAT